MLSFGAIFTFIYHTKQQNSWPNSSASCVVNYNWLSACQGEMEPFEDHLNTCGCLKSLRNQPQHKEARQLLASIPLVNVYSYCLMMKSLSCCCVHGSRLFSNLVTNVSLMIMYASLLYIKKALNDKTGSTYQLQCCCYLQL